VGSGGGLALYDLSSTELCTWGKVQVQSTGLQPPPNRHLTTTQPPSNRHPTATQPPPQEAMVVHKLFRMVFLGLSVNAVEGEVLLGPHLARLLDKCLERITKEEEIFGWVGGGRGWLRKCCETLPS
jgi:hypothetical protein